MEGVRTRYAKTIAKYGVAAIQIWCLEEITRVKAISLHGLIRGGGWIYLRHKSDDETIIRLRKAMDIPDGVDSGVIFVAEHWHKMYIAQTKSAEVRKGTPTLCNTGDKVGISEIGAKTITFTARFGEFHSLGQVHWWELKYSRNFLGLKFGWFESHHKQIVSTIYVCRCVWLFTFGRFEPRRDTSTRICWKTFVIQRPLGYDKTVRDRIHGTSRYS